MVHGGEGGTAPLQDGTCLTLCIAASNTKLILQHVVPECASSPAPCAFLPAAPSSSCCTWSPSAPPALPQDLCITRLGNQKLSTSHWCALTALTARAQPGPAQHGLLSLGERWGVNGWVGTAAQRVHHS